MPPECQCCSYSAVVLVVAAWLEAGAMPCHAIVTTVQSDYLCVLYCCEPVLVLDLLVCSLSRKGRRALPVVSYFSSVRLV